MLERCAARMQLPCRCAVAVCSHRGNAHELCKRVFTVWLHTQRAHALHEPLNFSDVTGKPDPVLRNVPFKSHSALYIESRAARMQLPCRCDVAVCSHSGNVHERYSKRVFTVWLQTQRAHALHEATLRNPYTSSCLGIRHYSPSPLSAFL